MNPAFEPSAELFLDARRLEPEASALLNHILDEVNGLALHPHVDGLYKVAFSVPFASDLAYRILWGQPIFGRSFWYIYEVDEHAELLRIHNIGYVDTEAPFLSRR